MKQRLGRILGSAALGGALAAAYALRFELYWDLTGGGIRTLTAWTAGGVLTGVALAVFTDLPLVPHVRKPH